MFQSCDVRSRAAHGQEGKGRVQGQEMVPGTIPQPQQEGPRRHPRGGIGGNVCPLLHRRVLRVRVPSGGKPLLPPQFLLPYTPGHLQVLQVLLRELLPRLWQTGQATAVIFKKSLYTTLQLSTPFQETGLQS